jgi:hypothetical protein
MYALTDTTVAPSPTRAARPTRAILRTRPRNQRIMIRSWDYIRPVRLAIVITRLLVAAWLVFLAVALLSGGYTWGLTLLAAAAVVVAVGIWAFTTAEKGWPVDGA